MDLAEVRKEAGMSQEELAEKLGVKQPTISSWERNRTIPKPYYMQKIQDIFGKPKEDIFLAHFTTKRIKN